MLAFNSVIFQYTSHRFSVPLAVWLKSYFVIFVFVFIQFFFYFVCLLLVFFSIASLIVFFLYFCRFWCYNSFCKLQSHIKFTNNIIHQSIIVNVVSCECFNAGFALIFISIYFENNTLVCLRPALLFVSSIKKTLTHTHSVLFL